MAFNWATKSEGVGLIVSKISNLCDPNPPTDGWRDDMQSQYRALHLHYASRGKN